MCFKGTKTKNKKNEENEEKKETLNKICEKKRSNNSLENK